MVNDDLLPCFGSSKNIRRRRVRCRDGQRLMIFDAEGQVFTGHDLERQRDRVHGGASLLAQGRIRTEMPRH